MEGHLDAGDVQEEEPEEHDRHQDEFQLLEFAQVYIAKDLSLHESRA